MIAAAAATARNGPTYGMEAIADMAPTAALMMDTSDSAIMAMMRKADWATVAAVCAISPATCIAVRMPPSETHGAACDRARSRGSSLRRFARGVDTHLRTGRGLFFDQAERVKELANVVHDHVLHDPIGGHLRGALAERLGHRDVQRARGVLEILRAAEHVVKRGAERTAHGLAHIFPNTADLIGYRADAISHRRALRLELRADGVGVGAAAGQLLPAGIEVFLRPAHIGVTLGFRRIGVGSCPDRFLLVEIFLADGDFVFEQLLLLRPFLGFGLGVVSRKFGAPRGDL